MKAERKVSKCKHCGKEITHFDGRLWHDAVMIFPQYCPTVANNPTEEGLHEPVDETIEIPEVR
jgi:hypothetical protein